MPGMFMHRRRPLGGATLTTPVFEQYKWDGQASIVQRALTGPDTVEVDDLLLVHLQFAHNEATRGTITPPSGWSVLNAGGDHHTDSCSTTYYKVAVSGDTTSTPQTYTFSWTGSTGLAAGFFRFSGVDATSPIDASTFDTTGNQNTDTLTHSSISCTNDNTLVLGLTGCDEASGTTPNYYTNPMISGFTNIDDGDSPGGSNTVIGSCYKEFSSGATGTQTSSVNTNSGDYLGGFLIALRPDGGS